MHAELENMVMAGVSPAKVLMAATKTSAEITGQNDLGMVAAGKSADFVVLDANPLDDMKNTRRISQVYLRGKQVDREKLKKGWATTGTAN
jgi:imidazolonepropionase-like amidohydrolase